MANIQTVNNTSSSPEQVPAAEHTQFRTPATDILENEDGYLLLADMPGVDPADISIQLEANVLSIEGKCRGVEHCDVVYQREFKVGSGVDPDGVSAELKHGVLHVKAKKNEARKPRKIAVNAK